MAARNRLTWPHTLAVAALLLGLTGGSAAAPAEKASEEGAGENPKPKKLTFRLPPNAFKEDGTMDQDVVLAVQKKHVEVLDKEFSTKFATSETAHYLILSDSSAGVTQQFAKCCEALYTNLQSQLSLAPKERVWDGKCVLMLFKARGEMLAYAGKYDEMESKTFEGYCGGQWTKDPRGPMLVYICMNTADIKPKEAQRIFVHEATHAFFFGYRSRVPLPTWLNEGIAEYMTVVNDASLHQEKWAAATSTAKNMGLITMVIEPRKEGLLEGRDYPIAYSLVEVLVTASKTKFKALVDALKDGKPQNEALKAAYGVDSTGLQKQWRTYLTSPQGAAKRK